ncbi:hypothetical protein BEP19_14460 [Ammoniphilus oxalaticus]|uniref:Uncharacterized protein n=1 Tax=Ammoniphilus oxalaticus TaxID=66863 RepID=A0A419SES2_9BACL|nr:hypothetical protein [Ammoniphilus oxalaticus]RKD21813.1 hypothetical protein BEP19_14460 [Ammoniphilus oxalaticus]
MRKLLRFMIVTALCSLFRFYLGEDSINFLWFIILYLPVINWSIYGLIMSIRKGLNRLRKDEWVTVPQARLFYAWYLNFPGAAALADLIYRGYVFHS